MKSYTPNAIFSLFGSLLLGAGAINAAPASTTTAAQVPSSSAAAAVTSAASGTASAEIPVITPGLFIAVPEHASLQSDKTVQPYGGMGEEDWEFKFFEPATYTQEVFKVSFYDGTKTATPTEIVHCTASATASPKEELWVDIVPTSAFVAQTSIPAPYGVVCTKV